MDLDEIGRLVDAIRPILGGHPPALQGAALADLLAIWLAGHFAGDAAANAAVREELLAAHIAVVRKLIPINEKWILRHREAPKDTVRQHRTGRASRRDGVHAVDEPAHPVRQPAGKLRHMRPSRATSS